MALRPALAALVEKLHAETPAGEPVSLDALGAAIDTMSIDAGEIDQMIAALEARGRVVGAKGTGEGDAEARPRRDGPAPGETRLRAVLTATRALKADLGRAPTRAEVAARAGLTDAEVAHALELARVLAGPR